MRRQLRALHAGGLGNSSPLVVAFCTASGLWGRECIGRGAYLAAWSTQFSWILEKAPMRMLFRSPRTTDPCQMLACTGGRSVSGGAR